MGAKRTHTNLKKLPRDGVTQEVHISQGSLMEQNL